MVIVMSHSKNFFVLCLHALCFLLTTDAYSIKCQFPSISTAQRKCFQQLTVPLFYLTDLDFTQIVTISDRRFTWFVWLAVTHWGCVTGFFWTTPASSSMRVDVYVSWEGAAKTLLLGQSQVNNTRILFNMQYWSFLPIKRGWYVFGANVVYKNDFWGSFTSVDGFFLWWRSQFWSGYDFRHSWVAFQYWFCQLRKQWKQGQEEITAAGFAAATHDYFSTLLMLEVTFTHFFPISFPLTWELNIELPVYMPINKHTAPSFFLRI